ncbi:thymidylate kinase [Roseibium hamelinense]|uniref:Thymidylate kinase n=1 Tax=Roseibium hamelinense TaxID=150831 RepID=A0A562SUK3_9HYPH|nr:thymidylate kinase [Roseibium hamelinense]MTI43203.1 thymidylate kinase [Roseibium hamelinense]TWI84748.1 thymidylate kinase [Roseibium hamelinense]
MKLKPVFVNIEGIDGSGKSTLAAALFDAAHHAGYATTLLEKRKLQGLSPYKEHHLSSIKNILWDYSDDDPIESLGDHHWYHLICSWFHAISEEIRNCEAQIVLSDGYYYKYLARFALKDGADLEYLRAAYWPILQPDLNIFLHIDPAVGYQRKNTLRRSESGALNGYVEQDVRTSFIDYQNRVSEILEREMIRSADVLKVDGGGDIDSIVSDVWQRIRDRLGEVSGSPNFAPSLV